MVVMLVILLVFGPDKVPEVGRRLGHAMRELMKARQEFMNSFTSLEEDDNNRRYSNYDPPRYDNYDTTYNNYDSSYPSYTRDDQSSSEPPTGWRAAIAPEEPRRGDFAAAAFWESAESSSVSSMSYSPPVTTGLSGPNGSASSNSAGSNGNGAGGKVTPPNGTVVRSESTPAD
jgi:TatA/E family protein of Tat protein translocase